MKIHEIERGSEAWEWLAWAFSDSEVRVVRIGDDEGTFKAKANEWGWSRPLNTRRKEKV